MFTDGEEPSEVTTESAGVTDTEDGDAEDDDDDEEEQNTWSITEPPPTSDRYGECLLPVTPARDPDLSSQSGLRFGETDFDGWRRYVLCS